MPRPPRADEAGGLCHALAAVRGFDSPKEPIKEA
jgi:hypothetical protein